MLIKFIATDGFIFDWERQFLMGGVETVRVLHVFCKTCTVCVIAS